ncbi:hypothetical protein [Lysobacter sp. CA199]|uniref:hypothetical protein n=1 Tax=Lysobacter sp. CA199 TaxID=3455608 RepID=UPI003F8D4AFD
MAMYLQLGHESWSLLDEVDENSYKGVVLSPVNDGPAYVNERLSRLKNKRNLYEVILDPQLYNPASQKGKLNEWSFYPSDFETADRSASRWWIQRATEVSHQAATMKADAICSPAFLDKKYSNEYYKFGLPRNLRHSPASN